MNILYSWKIHLKFSWEWFPSLSLPSALFFSPFVPLISFPQLHYNSELNYNADGTFSNLDLPSFWVRENNYGVRTTHAHTDMTHSLQNR
jgi:hypothetical protein